MSKLIQVTEINPGNGLDHPTPVTRLYGVAAIREIQDANGGNDSVVQLGRKIRKRARIVDEDPGTLLTAINAATPGDKSHIAVTVTNVEGQLVGQGFSGTMNIPLEDVLEVSPDPSDPSNDSIIILEQFRSQGALKLFVDETVAAILADANA